MFKKLAGLTAIAGLLFAGAASAQLAGSAHDFSDGTGFGGDTWNTSGEVCVVCHATHNTDTTEPNAPLWNHTVSSATYTPYVGFSMQATGTRLPSGVSTLCMSCHDGTVALDSYGTAPTTTTPLTGNALVGQILTDDHPIGIDYNLALNGLDTELVAFDDVNVAPLLDNGQVQCSSCHDVHNTANIPGGGLLVMSNANSALCNTCHIK